MNKKFNQNEVKKKKVSRVRTDRVRDYSNTNKLLNNQEFLERLLGAINKAYLDEE
ncbi:hypothetical protein IHV10_06420 [Fictibacillus sp. 5RED26]|uniref:hypothetical protein n=1 Tax=Fictibacillus sp. 5RED26 TaxID=2745876 RepID=UPI0018CECCBA|nr:hypothetical protein [Fictibacillus sp. 5RED26]MBH0155997.1 hypothetical protein [Fictibacillus sp. 5RED26]